MTQMFNLNSGLDVTQLNRELSIGGLGGLSVNPYGKLPVLYVSIC